MRFAPNFSEQNHAFPGSQITGRATLHDYERLALLAAPQRTAGGVRVYPPDTMKKIRFVKRAQLVGLTLHEIAALVKYQNHGGVRLSVAKIRAETVTVDSPRL